MYILGLNAFHVDCAACLFYNNKLIAAVEEKRLIRIELVKKIMKLVR